MCLNVSFKSFGLNPIIYNRSLQPNSITIIYNMDAHCSATREPHNIMKNMYKSHEFRFKVDLKTQNYLNRQLDF